MTAQGVRAGKAYVELFADNTHLQAGLRKAQAQLRAFASAMTGIGAGLVAAGAGILAPIGLAVQRFTATGDALDKMAARTGLSVEALSRLSIAADYSGAAMEDVETAIRKSGQAFEKAYGGDQQMAAAFAAIGLSLGELKKSTPDQMFHQIAAAIADIKNPTDQAYAAFLLLGKGGTTLLPLIQSLEDSERRAEAFGATMTRIDASKAQELEDAFTDVRYAIAGLVNVVGSTLQPALVRAATWLANAMKSTRDWIDQNRGLAITAALVGGGLITLGGALLAVGTAAAIAAIACGGLATAIGFIYTELAPAIPIALAAAAAISAVSYAAFQIATHTAVGQQALQELGAAFGDVRSDAVAAWDGISAAIQAGNLGGAIKVAMAFVKLEFTRGTAAVLNLADAFVAGVSTIFLNIGFSLNVVFRSAFNSIMNGIDAIAAYIATVFGSLLTRAGEVIATLGDGLASSGLGTALGLGSAAAGAQQAGGSLIDAGIGISNAAQRESTGRQSDRSVALGDFITTWENQIAAIGDRLAAGLGARDQEIAARQADLQAARDEMVAAKAAFDQAQKTKADQRQATGNVPLGSLITQLTAVKDTATGTFNAIASFGFGLGSTAADRTAAATEATSKYTKILADAAKSDSADTIAP